MKKIHYSYQQTIKDCRKLVKQLSPHKFDWIVAITRGGLVPACILSQLLDIKKIGVINILHYDGTKRLEDAQILDVPLFNIKDNKILIVDDVCDTGETLSLAFDLIKEESGKEPVVAVLHFKPKRAVLFEPDYYINETDDWIIYPWEIAKND